MKQRIWQPAGSIRGARRTGADARSLLTEATVAPSVDLSPRLDGPGSSQDLPQFAAMGTRLPQGPIDFEDPSWAWSRGSLRTPGLCVDGPPIRYRAVPAADPEAYEYWSPDFHTEPISIRSTVAGIKPNFVCNILAQFGMKGVRIEADPMPAVYRGTGLGGSNLAHAAAMILASALSGVDLNLGQIYVAATQLENYFSVEGAPAEALDFGVSLTGGQETLTALQGGIYDNVHVGSYYGPYAVASREIVREGDYPEISRHIALVNIGQRRSAGVTSSGINNTWMAAWQTTDGAEIHLRKPGIAYDAVEALRTLDWSAFAAAVREYRELRGQLAPDYLAGQEELATLCLDTGTEYFPLGGGRGSCLVTGPNAERVAEVEQAIATTKEPARGRTTLAVQIRKKGLRLGGFDELGLTEPSAP